jgi:DNA-binding NarL/FixJ family response regulator
VLVVDDQRLIRDGIASLLGLQPGIAVRRHRRDTCARPSSAP